MYDDVSGLRCGRHKAEIVSADNLGTSTIKFVYHMPGSSFGFGQPTLAETSLKLSNAYDE